MKNVIALILLGAAAFGVRQYALPGWEGVRQSRAKLAEVEDLTKRVGEIQEVRDAAIARLKSVSPSDMDRLDAMLPGELAQEDLYVFFETLVMRSGLTLKSVLLAGSQNSLAFDLAISGSYDNFRGFLDALENNLRIMDATSISISGSDNGIFSISIKGSMYYGS